MQRWIANLLVGWFMLLLPGATALQLAQPQLLLPACCRTHGAHHCSVTAVRHSTEPAWRSAGCPYGHVARAALLLPACVPAAASAVQRMRTETPLVGAAQAALSAWLAGLPASRAPPSLA